MARCVAAEDHLQKEDIDLCLRVSENLSNPRYQAGRYAPIEGACALAATWRCAALRCLF